MITAELILGILFVYITSMFGSMLIKPGADGKVIRSTITVIAFIILGILICSVNHRNSWLYLAFTRSVGGILLALAAAHVVMIVDIHRKTNHKK
ncbi:hypothetical protein PQC07_gp076 [Aeromonas phage D3]|uniref:Uncharacterized protein n=1 Tax=Aeromonas phage D3 TaxID=2593327 RepID=A0A514TV77_9CAUD|nr:hypothetical protein PQC07_gp076 [Aeromonas phage D3]QDJ96929.1 hypothetical protein D3_0199 [Aeromonas phage D3]QEP52235.1 hypothetical protein D9_0028 [Aeromonas phage D9]